MIQGPTEILDDPFGEISYPGEGNDRENGTGTGKGSLRQVQSFIVVLPGFMWFSE